MGLIIDSMELDRLDEGDEQERPEAQRKKVWFAREEGKQRTKSDIRSQTSSEGPYCLSPHGQIQAISPLKEHVMCLSTGGRAEEGSDSLYKRSKRQCLRSRTKRVHQSAKENGLKLRGRLMRYTEVRGSAQCGMCVSWRRVWGRVGVFRTKSEGLGILKGDGRRT